jgi:hypothetical protein
MPKLFSSIICFFTVIFMHAQTVDVPKGVIYKYASDKINNQSKEIIKKELSNKTTYAFFDKLVYCGPNLWQRYKNVPSVSKIENGNLELKVPQYDSTGKVTEERTMIGKLIQDKEDFKILWNQIIKDFEKTTYQIRKLNSKELSYYWAIIFYDIEEPIYVVDNGKYKLLIDVTNDMKLLWIDLVL